MGTKTGSLEEVILQPTRPAPYTGTLKPPVHTQTSSRFLCVVFVVLTSSMAHPPHCAQHTQAAALGLGVRRWGEGQTLEKCIPRSEAAEQRQDTLCPFEWTKCSALRGETLEPQSSETAVHRDWVKEGRRVALPCPGYCARDLALRPIAPPQSRTTIRGAQPRSPQRGRQRLAFV